MAVLAECPLCHRKQKTKNKVCSCGEDLDKAKRSKRVRFWIQYRLPGGKQRKEAVGTSIEEARDADGKRKVQKRDNRIFEMLPEATMTFTELTDWYLNLKSVKKLRSYERVAGWRISTRFSAFRLWAPLSLWTWRTTRTREKRKAERQLPLTMSLPQQRP